MKVKTKEVEEFTPIEIAITIESIKELCNLWNRANAAPRVVDNGTLVYGADHSSIELFNKLDTIVERLNLKK